MALSGLFLPLKRIYAENNLKSALKEVAENVQEISEVKNDEGKELQARKKALEKIFNLTLLENEDLKARLDGIKNLSLSEGQEKIRLALLNLLEENENTYREIRKRLGEAESSEEIKDLAADFKSWRNLVYNPKIEKIISFSLVFQQKKILNIARERLLKIEMDLKKLENSELIQEEDFSPLLQKAAAGLEKATELNTQAEALVTRILTDEFFPKKFNLKFLKIFTNPKEIKLTSKEKSESPTVKSLVEESLKEIKNVYKIFLDLSKEVKEGLK